MTAYQHCTHPASMMRPRGRDRRGDVRMRCYLCHLDTHPPKVTSCETVLGKVMRRHVVELATGCWVWTGAIDPEGYGYFGRHTAAYRAAYELFVGPIPTHLEPDHLCRNRACINPSHLELVTHAVNGLRGNSAAALNARKTHCMRGHPFDATNTYQRPGGGRDCLTCASMRRRRQRVEVAA